MEHAWKAGSCGVHSLPEVHPLHTVEIEDLEVRPDACPSPCQNHGRASLYPSIHPSLPPSSLTIPPSSLNCAQIWNHLLIPPLTTRRTRTASLPKPPFPHPSAAMAGCLSTALIGTLAALQRNLLAVCSKSLPRQV
eukprot:3074227-Rhodomonas_salina.8